MTGRKVRTCVRVRKVADEANDDECVLVDHRSNGSCVVTLAAEEVAPFPKEFGVERCYEPSTDNDLFYEECVAPRVEEALPGDTLCFLAYGHTSSGKTHTMIGNEYEEGMLPRVARQLLETSGDVEVTFLEIHNERVYDLLADGEERKVRRCGPKGSTVVEGLSKVTIGSMEEWYFVASFGLELRRSAATIANERSSRSHAIFTLKTNHHSICVVDLAGSERQDLFSAALSKESIAINKSLSKLSTVIEALSKGPQTVLQPVKRNGNTAKNKKGGPVEEITSERYINYRDTVLTVLLQRYLSGASLTTFIACVHPHSQFMLESINTLRYIAKLKKISTKGPPPPPVKTREQREKELEEQLEATVRALRDHQEAAAELSKQQQQRIGELEELSQHQLSCLATGSESDGGYSAQAEARARQSKRIAGWILSSNSLRQGTANTFTIMNDHFFDDMFPQFDVIGYATTMSVMLPPEADTVQGILDVGDSSMALSMLAAGVPPLVEFHRAPCLAGPTEYDAHPWEEGDVHVCTVFELDPSRTENLDTSFDGCSPRRDCCDGAVSCDPAYPQAAVFMVRRDAHDELRFAVVRYLMQLQEYQERLQETIIVSANTSCATIVPPTPTLPTPNNMSVASGPRSTNISVVIDDTADDVMSTPPPIPSCTTSANHSFSMECRNTGISNASFYTEEGHTTILEEDITVHQGEQDIPHCVDADEIAVIVSQGVHVGGRSSMPAARDPTPPPPPLQRRVTFVSPPHQQPASPLSIKDVNTSVMSPSPQKPAVIDPTPSVHTNTQRQPISRMTQDAAVGPSPQPPHPIMNNNKNRHMEVQTMREQSVASYGASQPRLDSQPPANSEASQRHPTHPSLKGERPRRKGDRGRAREKPPAAKKKSSPLCGSGDCSVM